MDERHPSSKTECPAWTIEELAPGRREAWERLVRTHPMGRSVVPMLEERAGWTPFLLGLHKGGELVGGLALMVRRIPGLPIALARVPLVMTGPHHHAEMPAALLEEVDRRMQEGAILETEIRLRIPANDTIEGCEYHRDVGRVLADFGYDPLAKIERSYLVRLDRDDDALLGSFSGKCRNIIRKALKSGATVSRRVQPQDLDQFYVSYAETCTRKGIPALSREAVVIGLQPLLESGHACLFAGGQGDQIAQMAIVDVCGTSCYTMGTRTVPNVAGEAPGNGQLLQFEIMRYLRDQGARYYDLGGCEGPVPVPGHPNYGVWHFKHEFQGTCVEFLPPVRKARGPLVRRLLSFVHGVRGDPM